MVSYTSGLKLCVCLSVNNQNFLSFSMNQPNKHNYITGQIFGKVIQTASHCSVEDAKAALMLYKKVEDHWDKKTNPFLTDTYWNDVKK